MPSSVRREQGTVRSSRRIVSALVVRSSCSRTAPRGEPAFGNRGRPHCPALPVGRQGVEQAPLRLLTQRGVGPVVLVGAVGWKSPIRRSTSRSRQPSPPSRATAGGRQPHRRAPRGETGDRHRRSGRAVPEPGQVAPESVVARKVRAQGKQDWDERAEPSARDRPHGAVREHGQSREREPDGPAEVDDPLELVRRMAREDRESAE